MGGTGNRVRKICEEVGTINQTTGDEDLNEGDSKEKRRRVKENSVILNIIER